VAITRQRLNQKLAGDLREWVDTGSRIVREASPARD
jgi:hypothetical protein